MGKDREMLHDILVDILGSNNVYYSPPDNMHMKFPCIIYRPAILGSRFADNTRYINMNQYSITVVDEDPDSKIADKILSLPSASSDAPCYTTENLNHWPLSIYF